jgi:hypothetical protein
MLTLTPAVLQQLKARGLQVPHSSALNLAPFLLQPQNGARLTPTHECS